MKTVASRYKIKQIEAELFSESSDDPPDLHALAVFDARHKLFDRDRLGRRQGTGPDFLPRWPQDDRRESSRAADTTNFHQISRPGLIRRNVVRENSSRFILHEESSVPIPFRHGHDSPNAHRNPKQSAISRKG